MPTKWVPPKIFMRLDNRDQVVYHAYKDGEWKSELMFVYNLSYNETTRDQIDVRDLMGQLSRKRLFDKDAKKLMRLAVQSEETPASRGWHKGVIRLAYNYGLIPKVEYDDA